MLFHMRHLKDIGSGKDYSFFAQAWEKAASRDKSLISTLAACKEQPNELESASQESTRLLRICWAHHHWIDNVGDFSLTRAASTDRCHISSLAPNHKLPNGHASWFFRPLTIPAAWWCSNNREIFMHPFSILTLAIFVAGYITARWDLITQLYKLAVFAWDHGVVVGLHSPQSIDIANICSNRRALLKDSLSSQFSSFSL